ncbi:MAG TPA: hypothetical protein VH969_34200 [Actinophytocola sp.]|jgi:hypothetical protein|uniref:hypothetical protein n=1 Tax=Actinophytocola sp. TaxID=1872138 RepID=UPI002F94EA09
MTTDDQLRTALRTVADEPAPPVATTLDHVVRRGRRRVLVQRGATVAAVVGVVATIGVGGVLLRGASEGQKLPPAGRLSPPSAVSVPTTPPTEAPTSAPTQTSKPVVPPGTEPVVPGEGYRVTLLPGWAPITTKSDGNGCGAWPALGYAPGLAAPPQDVVEPRFIDEVAAHAKSTPKWVEGEWYGTDLDTGAPRTFRSYEIDMGDGPASMVLEAGHFEGSPRKAADADVKAFGNCSTIQRKTLADGTILQLYPASFASPETPEQDVVVYAPNGRNYIVITQGWGESDVVNGSVPHGRGRLPLDDTSLASVAEMLAGLGT